jgi:NADPH:quinone reductase-like Zn-dependent oxidoreductase
MEMVRSLGADRVIDYTKEDFTKSGQRYDLLLDIAGSRSWSEYKRVLNPDAAFVIVGVKTSNRWLGPLGKIVKLRLGSLQASQKVSFFIADFNRQDFDVLKELCEAGKLKPVIERSYPFSELPEAMRHLGRGHLRGKIVVSLAG